MKPGSTLIDGHNRFEICTRLHIPFQTVQREFANREKAVEWIILNQFGRRNLPAHERARLALRLKPMIAEKAKENLVSGAEMTNTGLQKSVKAVNTQSELAKVAGVSTQRIYQRLAKDLQSYYQEQNGSKYIDFQALSLFGMDIESPDLQSTCKELAKDLQTPLQPLAKSLQAPPTPAEQAALAALQSVIDSQRARIAELESDAIHAANHRQRAEQAHEELRERAEQWHRERDELKAELKGERERAAEIAAERDRLGAIVERLTATIQADAAARALTAKESQAAIETAAQTAEQGGGTQSGQPAADQSEDAAPVKRGLFARLFKRKPSG